MLYTVAEIVDAVGSLRLQRITRKRSNNVTNWKAANRFPPRTYLLIQAELTALGLGAPARLWGIVEPRKQRAA